jgi:hypothetical protein
MKLPHLIKVPCEGVKTDRAASTAGNVDNWSEMPNHTIRQVNLQAVGKSRVLSNVRHVSENKSLSVFR